MSLGGRDRWRKTSTFRIAALWPLWFHEKNPWLNTGPHTGPGHTNLTNLARFFSISLELQVEPWRCGGRGRCTGNRPHPWRHRAGAHRRETVTTSRSEANIKGFS